MSRRLDPDKKIDLRAKGESNFYAKVREIHGDKFDYSLFEYVNAKTKSIIICPEHGKFLQNPDRHIHNTHACPGCWSKTRRRSPKPVSELLPGFEGQIVFVNDLDLEKFVVPKGGPPRFRKRPFKAWSKVTVESFLERLNLPDDMSVDVSGFITFTEGLVIITCPEHGKSSAPANVVLQRKFRCEECGKSRRHPKVRPFSEFLEAVHAVHGDKYSIPYPEEYENRKSWITVVCAKHGAFSKKGQKLLAGQGCLPCRMEEMVVDGTLSGGYNARFFVEHPELKDIPATVYYLKLGNIYKIGITRNKLGNRLRSIKSESKMEPVLLDEYACTLLEAYRLEQVILHDFHLVRTLDTWSTELFTEDVMGESTLAEYAKLVLS